MRDYEDELSRYELEAEQQYDDYHYDGEDPGEDYEDEDAHYDDDYDYEEADYLPAMGDAEDYDNYHAGAIGRIDPNDRTLTVVVTNTSGADAEAVLFGGNEEAAQAAGVTVSVKESSHKEVREESKANPFKIAGMKMSVSDPLQFDNVITIHHRSATGSKGEQVYQPRNATSPQNFTQQLIDDDNFEMTVTGRDSMRLMIKKSVTVVFTFTIKARANMGNILRGNNVAELSTTPRTTGLPQLDLLRKRRPSAFGLHLRKPRKIVRKRPIRPPVAYRPKPRYLKRRR